MCATQTYYHHHDSRVQTAHFGCYEPFLYTNLSPDAFSLLRIPRPASALSQRRGAYRRRGIPQRAHGAHGTPRTARVRTAATGRALRRAVRGVGACGTENWRGSIWDAFIASGTGRAIGTVRLDCHVCTIIAQDSEAGCVAYLHTMYTV